MGVLNYNEKTGSIEIVYGGPNCPFMGIDSSAPDPYIGPNQLTKASQNVFVNNGSLTAMSWQAIVSGGGIPSTQLILGVGDLAGEVFLVSYDTTTGNILVYNIDPFGATFTPTLFATIQTGYGLTLVWNPQPWTLTYKNVNGICYFSFVGSPFIFQHNNMTGALLTNYLGAAFLNELNGRLIAANVFQISSANTTNYAPTSSQTGIAATAINGSTQTQTSTVTTFASQAVSGGQSVQITVNILNAVYNCNPQGNTANVGTLEFQYSTDGGTTWTTFQQYNFTEFNQTIPPSTITLPLSGITNLNQIEVRVVASVTAGTGSSTVSTATGTVQIVAATVQNVASILIQEFPYQYAWSAAQGAYSQFNPLVVDAGTGVEVATGAGFNNLPDVEDVITGLFNTGPTEFVLRQQGITEVTALNSGIQPFAFNHLWASHKGIGTAFPNTVGQYGGLGVFFSDTDIYSFGYEGINTIGNKAISAIYTDLISTCGANFLCGGMAPVYFAGETFLAYFISAFLPSSPYTQYIWMYNTKTKEWYRFLYTPPSACLGVSFIPINTGIITPDLSGSVPNYNSFLFGASFGFFSELDLSGLPSIPVLGRGASVIVFPAEEVNIGRDISIDSIIVYFAGSENTTSDLQITATINGTSYSTISSTLNNPLALNTPVAMNGQFQYVSLYPLNGNPYTGKSPQLTLSATDTAGIPVDTALFGKIVLLGSVDSVQRPS